jgi:hypothetical protein
MSALAGAAAVAGALALTGCTRRTITVTSQPAGALVWLNDQQVGRTPVSVDFVHFGIYDVRLRLEGYEPVMTARSARAPLHEWPGLDLVTAPLPLHTRIVWHFELTPVAESVDRAAAERALLDRARALQRRAVAGLDATPPGESSGQ